MKRFLQVFLSVLFAAAFSRPFLAQGAEMAALPGALNAEDLPWASDGEANVPYVFHDPGADGKLAGFEYDIVQALARRLGKRPRFVQNGWDGLIPGLSRGLYAFAIDGIELTPEHQAAADFTRPYYITSERLIVRDGTRGIDSLHDLRGRKAGTIKNSRADRMLQAHGASVATYEEESDLFADLRSGRIRAALVDDPIAQYYLAPGLHFAGPPVGRVAYGIAVSPHAPGLRRQLDQAIAALMGSGELKTILERWNLWNPQMAEYTGDFSPAKTPPAAWENYRHAMQEMSVRGWRGEAMRLFHFLPAIGYGAAVTLAVSVLSMCLAIVLGVVLALLRHYGSPPWRTLAAGYIELIRGTPLLIQILFVFYALPVWGITLSPFVAGVAALGLNYAAYEAENYRAGLMSVPRGQMEAAQALNLTRVQALRFVIAPQAFRTVIPVMTNDFIALLKDSSLVSVITLTDLTQVYVRLASTYYDYIGPGILVGLVYLLIGWPFSWIAKRAERKVGHYVVQGHH